MEEIYSRCINRPAVLSCVVGFFSVCLFASNGECSTGVRLELVFSERSMQYFIIFYSYFFTVDTCFIHSSIIIGIVVIIFF